MLVNPDKWKRDYALWLYNSQAAHYSKTTFESYFNRFSLDPAAFTSAMALAFKHAYTCGHMDGYAERSDECWLNCDHEPA